MHMGCKTAHLHVCVYFIILYINVMQLCIWVSSKWKIQFHRGYYFFYYFSCVYSICFSCYQVSTINNAHGTLSNREIYCNVLVFSTFPTIWFFFFSFPYSSSQSCFSLSNFFFIQKYRFYLARLLILSKFNNLFQF